MRKQPNNPPEVTPQKQDDITTQVREYKLITPLFGGGATAGEGDPVTLIRGTEIRGLLRFWWRACRGGNYQDLKALKEAEDKFWGAANKKPAENEDANKEKEDVSSRRQTEGTVQIAVEQQLGDVLPTPYSPDVAPPYAAFPLQENRRENRPRKNVYENVSFTLIISFPEDFKQEIETALWAWETFGGIGARTRRGFGALQLLKVDNNEYTDLPFANELLSVDNRGKKNWLEMKLTYHVVEGTPPEGIPHLSRNMQYKVKYSSSDPFVVWNNLIKRLSGFRQFPNGRDKRSKWPEAETIRGITGDRDSKFPPLSHPQKFPRAAFGLPIVFHFRDDDINDPEDTTLQGPDKETERLASPLILRPLACKNNTFVGLALLLEGSPNPPQNLKLVEKNGTSHSVDANINKSDVLRIEPLGGKTDVLQAFMKYL